MAELRADPFATEWITGKKSAARLIAAPSPAKGAYRAGVQIRLDPGAHTYWRSPGEVGAPPVFNFEGSENIKDVVVHYPTPARIDEAGLVEFGYRGAITFPVDVKLADDSRPGVLSLSLTYAVCGGICLPAAANAKLALPVKSEDGAELAAELDAEALITAAKAKVPRRLSAAERDAQVAIVRDSAAVRPTWRVKLREAPQTVGEHSIGGESAKQDLFVELTDGYYFESKKSDRPNEFLIVEVEAPDKSSAAGSAAEAGKIPITITLAQPRQSYEFTAGLDASPTHP